MNTQNNVTPKQWSISNGKLKIFYILANIFWILAILFNIYGLTFANEGFKTIFYIYNFIITALFAMIVNAILFTASNKKKAKLFYSVAIIAAILGFLLLGNAVGGVFDI